MSEVCSGIRCRDCDEFVGWSSNFDFKGCLLGKSCGESSVECGGGPEVFVRNGGEHAGRGKFADADNFGVGDDIRC